jgi:hypothetical protein
LLDVDDLRFESFPLRVVLWRVWDLGSWILPLPAERDLDRHAVEFLDSDHVLLLLVGVSKCGEFDDSDERVGSARRVVDQEPGSAALVAGDRVVEHDWPDNATTKDRITGIYGSPFLRAW